MEKFCRFCGQELINDQCECEAFQQAQLDAKVRKWSYRIWKYSKRVGREMLRVMRRPMDAIAVEGKELKVSFTMGALLIFVIFCSNFMNPIYLGSTGEMGLKLQMAFWITAIPALSVIGASFITFSFIEREKTYKTYKKILATYCVATAPSTIIYCVGYLLGFLWSGATVIGVFFGILSWIILSIEATSHELKDKNLMYWVMFLIALMTILVIVICGSEIISFILIQVMEVYEEYLGSTVTEMKGLFIELLNQLLLGE